MSQFVYRFWSPPSAPGKGRVYVHGLQTEGRSYLALIRGNLQLVCENATPEEQRAMLMLILAEFNSFGIDIGQPGQALWTAIMDHVGNNRQRGAPTPHVGASLNVAPRCPESPSSHGLVPSTIKLAVPETIVVDHREPDEIIRQLKTVPSLDVRIEALETGDYVIGDKVIVERKSVADFEASIINDDKRLFVQSERIKHLHEMTGVVLLEGDLFGRRQRMGAHQISGALTYLGIVQGLNVLTTIDATHTAYMLAKIAQHLHGLGYDLALRTDKPKALLSARSYVLEGIPGVSAGMARALLERFGSIQAIAAASTDDLCTVPGIGPARARSIVEVFQ